jgi:fucose 4-O-acetylase-like acetyltransferase
MPTAPTRNIPLDLVRVISIFLVLSIHSPFEANIKSAAGFSFLRSWISFIAYGAVPVFFLLSGYLGARKIDSMSVSTREYIREKTHALVLPFLTWNAAVLLLVFLAKGMGWDSPFRGSGRYFDVNFWG